ncbi:hypothetical protein [Pleomorphomonas sp. PLEO]|uniref:hypothetical protein n=1 Tax=Pleomorphomonas sp. PLEO TaxID=3239306 RepID=UPI00351E57FE
MVDAAQMRYSASKMIFWKWAFGIGVGAACAGAVVVIERGPSVPPPVVVSPPPIAELSPPIEATGTVSIGGTPLTTASVDVATGIETPSPAATLLPPEKPKSAVSKIFRVRETTPTGVAHFDTCLPSCETRDPQVVGQEQADLAPEPAPSAADMPPVPVGPVPPALIPPVAAVMPPPAPPVLEPFDVAPLPPPKDVVGAAIDGGKHLINRVERTSDAVVAGTKRALDVAVDLVW